MSRGAQVAGGLAAAAAPLLLVAWMLPASWLFADTPGVLYPPMEPLPTVGSLSAQRCGACHPDHYAEWKQSRHAQAVSDPLYQADLHHQQQPFFCDQCHAPLLEQQPLLTSALVSLWPRWRVQRANARFDEKLHAEGVTCVACHQVDGAIDGPRGDPAPHPARRSAALASEQVCERCHTLAMTRIGSLQRPLMETVTEWREYRALGGDQVCQGCHLPAVAPRPAALGAEPKPGRSHRLLGPFDDELVRRAVEVKSVELGRPAAGALTATVRLVNATGHRLPTAEPHRWVRVALEGLGAGGAPVVADERRVERVVDLRTLREAPGQDSTFLPREERAFQLSVPLQGDVRSARVRAVLHLWAPEDPVAKEAGLGAQALEREVFAREFPISVP